MSETVMQDRHWEIAHPFAQWLSDHLPILVPEPATERRLRRWNQWADRQRTRRVLAALIVFLLAFVFAIWIGEAYLEHVRSGDGHGLFYRIVVFVTGASMGFQVGVVIFWSKVTYMLAGSSTEDLALLEYGMPYDKLTAPQRRKMLVRQRATMFVSCFRADERQSAEQERAERAAYRLLRRAVTVIVIVTWAAYLIVPERAFGWLLQWVGLMMKSPLMLTWLAMVLIALPVLIRLWTEPDGVGEVRVVAMEREA
jgi:hypothetical protein